jgi:PD-(D/E)XK endonuclease
MRDKKSKPRNKKNDGDKKNDKKNDKNKANGPHHNLKNTKRVGERSEAAFLLRASQLGYFLCKPWGDSNRYDFIVDNGPELLRVQVKCTESIRARAYETRATYTVGNRRAVYTSADIEFIAAHVVPLDIWYIIPVDVCTPAPMLRFYPHRKAKKMRLEKYREAWHYLDPTDPSRRPPITIQAVADETVYPSEEPEEENEEKEFEPEPVMILAAIPRVAFFAELREAPFTQRRT